LLGFLGLPTASILGAQGYASMTVELHFCNVGEEPGMPSVFRKYRRYMGWTFSHGL
jgi:hypothetical protein